MAQAIIAMGTAAEAIQEDVSFTAASLAETSFQQASGMRIPIKSQQERIPSVEELPKQSRPTGLG
jgi:hypothetical protein